MSSLVRASLLVIGLAVLTACGVAPEKRAPATTAEVAALAAEIRGLSDTVDPAEALRAAQLSYSHTRALAIEYEITDHPIIHNMKVNAGLKPRGLCWHWAEDMENRLNAEGFETLVIHRAIANADDPDRLTHSTAIVASKGEGMFEGIVLDPWRKGGILFWDQVLEDTRYTWVHRKEVHDARRQQLIAEGKLPAG